MSRAEVELEPDPLVPPTGRARAALQRKTSRALLGLMLLAIALRVLRYVADRSLWLDEAYLANSILTYSWRQLITQPLMQWQAAPVGFLLLQKGAVTLFGGSEYALRLVPLIAGIASVPLFYGIIRRCLAPTGQVLAMAMFAIVDPLIYYASEGKQYGLDVTVALAILLATLRVRERPRDGSRWVLLGVVGALGIFFSHPALFTLAVAGLVLGIDAIRGRGTRDLRGPIALGLLWIGVFLADYFEFLRPLTHHEGLRRYWEADFMPYVGLPACKWIGWELYELYHGYLTMWLPLVDTAILATLIGFVPLWKRDRGMLALLIGPLIVTLGAAIVHAYPFGSRLVLFLVPSLIVLIGAGSAVIWESVMPGRRFVAVLILLSIYLPTAARDAYYLIVPQRREEIRPVLAYIRDHKRPGDSLYVFAMSEVPFHYYEDRFGLLPNRLGLADMPTIIGQPANGDPSVYRADLARLRGKGRVWVLITHPRAMGGVDEEQLFPTILDQWGKPLDHVQAFNASATLYDLH